MVRRPFLCPTVIGREQEQERLRSFLQSSLAGQGGTLLLAGEAGIGKSRLLAEFLAGPDAAACDQVWAACLEPDQAVPYGLVEQLAAAALASPDEVLADDAPGAASKVRRVERALRRALARHGGGRPVILVAEDLQWSDQSSLNVLLARAQQPRKLVLLGTYRPAPLSPALAWFLAEMQRLPLATDLPLRRLRRGEVARLIHAALDIDAPVPGGLLDEVMVATEGNPFLVEEVCRSLLESGDLEQTDGVWRRPGASLAVPRSLRYALEARLLALAPETVAVAQAAAVVGPNLDVQLLSALTALAEDKLLLALRELTQAQVLVAVRTSGVPDGLAFRHELSRAAVLDRLIEPERRALHRRVAELFAANPATPPALLAYHWSRAGDVARAAPYALQAAERAAALHAHREALQQYELALEGTAAPEATLLTALGDQHAALGEREPALRRYEEARSLYVSAGKSVRVAELELRIGTCYARERWRRTALYHLAEAFATLPAGHPERWQAGLALALQQAALGEHCVAEATLDAASGAAVSVGGIASLRISYELGGVRARRGDWAALEQAGQAVLAAAVGDTDDMLSLRHDAHAALGSLAYYRGAFASARECFLACREIAEQRGQTMDHTVARWNLAANVAYYLGDWEEARAELAELRATGYGWLAEAARWFGLWLDGRWEEAAAAAKGAWPRVAESADIELQQGLARRVADILLTLGHTGEALALVRDVLERAQTTGASSYAVQLAPWQAEALARAGDPGAERAIADGLALARQLGARPAEALFLRTRSLVHRDAGGWPEAFGDCAAAAELFGALSMPYEEGRTRCLAAAFRLARGRRGDRERAAADLRAAHRLFSSVGADRDAAAAQAVLSAAGLVTGEGRAGGPLSARERAVASAIAQGLSNREIADRLFITETTVAHHVGAILSKLGFHSRTQVAAFVAGHLRTD